MLIQRKRELAGWGIALAVPVLFLILFFGWPVGAIMLRGFTGETGVDLGGFTEVLGVGRTWRIIGQTVGMAAAATAGSLVLGIPAAYVLYRIRFRGQAVLRAIAVTPFVLPTVAVGVAFRSLLAANGPLGFLGLDQSVTAVVLAMMFFNYGLVARTVGNLWAGLDAHDDAARTLGASPWYAFRTVTLPQLGPGIAAAAGLVFLFCSTSFGIVQTLGRPGYGTVESEIYTRAVVFLDLRGAAVLGIVQVLIVLGALVISNRLTARTETTLTMTTRELRWARRGDAGLIGLVLATVAVLIVSPLLSLLVGSLRKDGQWTLHYYRVLGQTGEGYSGGTSVFEALEHSLRIAVDATMIALAIGVPLALALGRQMRSPRWKRAQNLLDMAVLMPLGVSSVIVGFGFLVTWGRIPSINSAWIVPLAQAVVALPLVIRSLVPVLRGIDPKLREAAATLGARPARVWWTIDMPFVLRGLGLAGGFAFAMSLGEFGATSFLSNPNYQTLPVLIGRLLGRPGADNYGMALAGTVVLIVVTSAAMLIGELLRPRVGGQNLRSRIRGRLALKSERDMQ
ncbi:MAG: iron ABC transporter permease [Actinomycetaceae bacterium]|nr:iron ABC transporter permease [Actinomycetaceae bacterium]